MLKFLKKIFQKEEPIEKEEIKEAELEEWLQQKISKIDFQGEIVEFYNQIKDKKWMLNEKIEILENTAINEKEIVEEKIKNIVVGHKENYIRACKQFLTDLKIPEEESLDQALVFSQEINQSLDELSKRTAKSYQAAQHLFFNQVEDIFNNLSSINNLVGEFNKKLERIGAHKTGEIRKKILSLNDLNRKKEILQKELGWKNEKLHRCLQGKEKQGEELKKLEESEDYQEFKSLKEKQEKLSQIINDNKDKVFLFFSKLSRVLRKYERVALDQHTIQKYLDNPSESFFEDHELKILEILTGLETNITNNKIDLDDKKKVVVLEAIAQAQKGYLKEILERDQELKNKVNEVKAKLRRYNVDKLIEEAKYKLDHFTEQIVLVKREIEEWNYKLNTGNTKEILSEIKKIVKDVFKIEVNFVLVL